MLSRFYRVPFWGQEITSRPIKQLCRKFLAHLKSRVMVKERGLGSQWWPGVVRKQEIFLL